MIKNKNNIAKHVSAFILILILSVVILFVGKRVLNREKFTTVFGYGIAYVISKSMTPEIYKGDIVLVKEQENYEIGDIITYSSGETLITHRIKLIEQKDGAVYYTTQGDTNDSKDPPITRNQICGKVIFNISIIDVIATIVLIGIIIYISPEKENNLNFLKE